MASDNCQYGASKHTVEHYLYMYKTNYGLDYTVFRYPNVYGPRQDPHGEAGVVAIFTGQMLNGETITINGDGDQERDFVYVGDCALANWLAIEGEDKNGIYNLASGTGTTVNEIYNLLKQITGYQQEPRHGPAKLGETRKIYLDASKAQRDFGWSKKIDLLVGLQKTVEYFKSSEKSS